MTSHKKGAIASQTIAELIQSGFIMGATEDNVRPASLDLSISDEVYSVGGVFQPRPGETVREVLELIDKKKHDLKSPLQREQMYIARLNETLELPETVYAFCNPKSTTGRLDIHVRLIADGVPRYDSVTPGGWKGELWVSIVPKTFPIKVAPGQSLNQLRFFNADTRLDQLELEMAMKRDKLLWNPENKKPYLYEELLVRDNDDSLILSLDGMNDLIGYRGRIGDTPIDLAKIGGYDPKDFFEPVKKDNGYIYLKQNEFYILSTREAVKVPPTLACEMAPMDERSGEFRSHYAGFIDPGWGYGKEGEGNGRPLTLEVRPFEDLVARDGQPIAKIRFERVTETPDQNYDQLDSNYSVQSGPRLAKQFKAPKNK
ncbi:MAG: 2'-deoxycytidine 5'-triphosphate deaminase [Candidatus Paceibacterota bacterium]